MASWAGSATSSARVASMVMKTTTGGFGRSGGVVGGMDERDVRSANQGDEGAGADTIGSRQYAFARIHAAVEPGSRKRRARTAFDGGTSRPKAAIATIGASTR